MAEGFEERNQPLFLGAREGSRGHTAFGDLPAPRLEGPRLEGSLKDRLDEAKREVLSLLQEVSTTVNAGLNELPPDRSIRDLLLRAVRCAFRQSLLQAELGNLALIDELTGLYNRRGFLTLFERQLTQGRRAGSGLLFLFADLDGLKRINDEWGHAEGDRALKRVAGVLQRTFRETDVMARFGGDEFAVLAVEAVDPSGAAIVTRLRQGLEESSRADPRYPLSLSIGVVRVSPMRKTSIGQLLLRADRAMYENKHRRSLW